MTVHILRGPSGCGKSTTAREHKSPDDVIVSRDLLRRALTGTDEKTVLPTEQERMVTSMEMDMLRRAVREGHDVWVANTNLDGRHAEKYATEAHILGVDFQEVNLYDPELDDMYVERSDVPESVVRKQCRSAKKMHTITARVEQILPVKMDARNQRVFIFDIDGTLAHIDPKNPRSPYDGSRLTEDLVDWPVANVASALDEANFDAIFAVSGRHAKWRMDTLVWLYDQAGVIFDHVFFRANDDDRHDAQVKYEILRDQIAPGYNVAGVFDDRHRVVSMWQSAGLKTFDVGMNRSDF